jgi:ketosteroid isomerase-like protein
MIKALTFTVILLFALAAGAKCQKTDFDNPADAAAVRAEIEGITQAFVDGDIEKIYATHSEDWRGFLEGTQKPIVGVNDYMKANGIAWPLPASYKKPMPDPKSTYGFQIPDFDVHFVTPDVGVANFILDFGNRTNGKFKTTNRLRIMDVFAKRGGKWIQVASNTVVDPAWRASRMSSNAVLNDRVKQQILAAREEVWRAWFSNDRVKLDQLIPDEALALESGDAWQDKAAILAGAKQFADSGAKLTKLEFPRTEIQMYGNTVILFTSYSLETEKDGKKLASSGNAIETFVRRDNRLVNTGWILSGK